MRCSSCRKCIEGTGYPSLPAPAAMEIPSSAPGKFIWCDHHKQWGKHETKDCMKIPYRQPQPVTPSPAAWPTPPPPTPYQRPQSARPRLCLYCCSPEHSRWQCPKVASSRQVYCFNCGLKNHMVDQCPVEFNRQVIDMNYQRFIKALKEKEEFVPIQDVAPEVVVTPCQGEFNDQVLSNIHTKVPQPQTMTQTRSLLKIQFSSKADAIKAYSVLKEIHDLKVATSWPLSPSQPPVMDGGAASITTMTTTTRDLERIQLQDQNALAVNNKVSFLEQEIVALKNLGSQQQATLQVLQQSCENTALLLQQLVQRLAPQDGVPPVQPPTTHSTGSQNTKGSSRDAPSRDEDMEPAHGYQRLE